MAESQQAAMTCSFVSLNLSLTLQLQTSDGAERQDDKDYTSLV